MEKKPVLSGSFGLGAELVAFAGPVVYPDAPILIWQAAFWSGIVLILFSVYLYATPRLHIPRWAFLWPFGMISLHEASRIVYEEVRVGYWGGAAEAFGGSPDGVLDYLSIPISERTTIYGRRPPSTKMESIPRAHIKAGKFVNGAKSHARRDDMITIEYVDLSIKRSAIRGIIHSMKPNEETDA
jgi:hypothetical protein